jgi:hypothetical protein
MKSMLLLLLLFLAGTAALARDDGQYQHVAPAIRRWFHDLRSPRGGFCCDETDCLRTEARLSGNRWQARARDGKWIDIPPSAVIKDRGNPIGEPILCASWAVDGWYVRCFVPGALT